MKSNQARLNTGNVVPLLGFGTYSCTYDYETTQKAIYMAIKVIYINSLLLFLSFISLTRL